MVYMFTLPTIFVVVATGIVDVSIILVEGFTVTSQPTELIPSSTFSTTKTHQFSPSSICCSGKCRSITCNLFRLGTCNSIQSDLSRFREKENSLKFVEKGIENLHRRIEKATNQFTDRVIRFWMNCRRPVLSFFTIVLFWVAAAGIYTPKSHCSSDLPLKEVAKVTKNGILSASMNEIVDGYVTDHMFDDDVYDPVETIYREAMNDKLKGSYPKDLKEVASSVLGQNALKAEKKTSGFSVSGGLVKAVDFLRRQGLSEIQAIAIITGSFVIGAPAIAFTLFISIASQNKRSMNQLMKERYGDTYSVDATVKEDEDIGVPDEEDDDDDEEDDE